MGFFEKFRKPKAEVAAAVVAGTISAVAPAAAAEMPQHVEIQKPTTIERVTGAVAPGLAKIQMEDGRTATLNVPSEPQAVSVTPEAFQVRPLAPEPQARTAAPVPEVRLREAAPVEARTLAPENVQPAQLAPEPTPRPLDDNFKVQ